MKRTGRIALALTMAGGAGVFIWQGPALLHDCPGGQWAGPYCYTPMWMQIIAVLVVPPTAVAACTYVATTLAAAHDKVEEIAGIATVIVGLWTYMDTSSGRAFWPSTSSGVEIGAMLGGCATAAGAAWLTARWMKRRRRRSGRLEQTTVVAACLTTAAILGASAAENDARGEIGWIYDPATHRVWSGTWDDRDARTLSVEWTVENAIEELREHEAELRLMQEDFEEWEKRSDAEFKETLAAIEASAEDPESITWASAEVVGEWREGGSEHLPPKLRKAMLMNAYAEADIHVGKIVLITEEMGFESGAVQQIGKETVEGAIIGAGNAQFAVGQAGLI